MKKNIIEGAGWKDISDDDLIDEFELDPAQDINKQMFDKVEQMNVDAYLRAGLDIDQAQSKAKDKKSAAMKAAAFAKLL